MDLKKLFNKKGIAQVPGILQVILIVSIIMIVLGISLTYGGDIEEDVRDDQTSGSVAEGIANESLLALQDIAEKQDSISSVVIAAAIIAVLIAAFGGLVFMGMRR